MNTLVLWRIFHVAAVLAAWVAFVIQAVKNDWSALVWLLLSVVNARCFVYLQWVETWRDMYAAQLIFGRRQR